MSPGGQPLATFADRLLAYLVDAAVFLGVVLLLAVPAIILFFAAIRPDIEAVADSGAGDESTFFMEILVAILLLEAAVIALTYVAAYVYYVEMMFRSGQTLGKKIMKIKVVPLDPAATLTRGSATKRFLVQHVAGGLVPGLSYLDGLWQLWDKPYQQCLHDKFAKTLVVKVPG